MHLCEMCSEEMRKVINIFNSRSFYLYTKRENLLKNMPENLTLANAFIVVLNWKTLYNPLE